MSNPTEQPTDHPRTATAFEKELWVFQNDSPKTPTSAMSNAGCVVGMGVFLWVVFFGLRLVGLSVEDFFKDSGTLLGIAGILLLILATLSPIIGAGLFLVALVRPKRSVKCPYCLADHTSLPAKQNALLDRLVELLNLESEQVKPQKWPEPLMKLEDTGLAIAVRDADLVRRWASRLTTPSQIGKVRVPGEALMSMRKL